MISPAGPAILAALGATAAVLTVASLAWYFMPTSWKHSIKRFFGFGKKSYDGLTEKQELEAIVRAQQESTASPTTALPQAAPARTSTSDFNLFKQEQRKLEIVKAVSKSPIKAREMLINAIKTNIHRLAEHSPHHNHLGHKKETLMPSTWQERVDRGFSCDGFLHRYEDGKLYESKLACMRGEKPISDKLNKQGQKIQVLNHLLDALNNMFEPGLELTMKTGYAVNLRSIADLHQEYPYAFQSFFSSTSNTESLHDSVKFFIDNYKEELKAALNENYRDAAPFLIENEYYVPARN